MSRDRIRVVAAAFAAALCTGQASAGDCQPAGIAPLQPTNPDQGDRFGTTMTMDGDILAIGAPRNYDNSIGIVYVFERDAGGAWQQAAVLNAPNAVTLDGFGIDLDLDGERLIVGSEFNVPVSGAYIFERDAGGPGAWGLVKHLLPSDGADAEFFGHGVAIDGDLAIIGAYGIDAAYVFERNAGGADNWGEVARLEPAEVMGTDEFGWHTAIAGDTAMVSAWADDVGGANAGAAYVFQQDLGGANAWGQVTKLVGEGSFDQFGRFGMDMDGAIAVVGVPDLDDVGTNAGGVYVFRRNFGGPENWGLQQKIFPSRAQAQSRFGQSVTVRRIDAGGGTDVIAAGAPLDDQAGDNAGAAHVFTQPAGQSQTWAELVKLVDSSIAADAETGQCIGFGNGVAAAGAPRVDQPFTDAGMALAFDLGGCFAAPGDLNGDGVVDVFDLFALLDAWGPCSGCPEDLTGDGVVDVFDLFDLLANWG